MKRIICVLGKSGSGKDFLTNTPAIKRLPLQKIKKVTTRPMRPDEKMEEDKTNLPYEFLSDKEFDMLETMAVTSFQTEHGVWKYGFVAPDFDENPDINTYLAVTDPGQLEAFLSYYQDNHSVNIVCVYVETQDYTRLKKSMQREMDLYRICARFCKDADDFDGSGFLNKMIRLLGGNFIRIHNTYDDSSTEVFYEIISRILISPMKEI